MIHSCCSHCNEPSSSFQVFPLDLVIHTPHSVRNNYASTSKHASETVLPCSQHTAAPATDLVLLLSFLQGRALSSQHYRATHPHGPNGPRRAQDGRTPRPSTPLPQSTIPSSPVPSPLPPRPETPTPRQPTTAATLTTTLPAAARAHTLCHSPTTHSLQLCDRQPPLQPR